MKNDFKIINLNYINLISNGDAKFIKELIELFLDQIPVYQINLNEYYKQKDWYNLGRAAHKAISAILMMGMEELASELKKIEENTKEEKNIGKYQEIIVKFVEDTNTAIAELKELLEKIK